MILVVLVQSRILVREQLYKFLLASETSLQVSEAPSLVMKTGGYMYVKVKGQRSTRLRMRGIITWQPMQPV